MYHCPENHPSTTPDFCSVCGTELTAAAGPPATPSPPPAGPAAPSNGGPPGNPAAGKELCPDCGIPKESPRQIFCEVCGYNYRTRSPGTPPLAVPTLAPTPAAPAPVAGQIPPTSPTPPAVAAGNENRPTSAPTLVIIDQRWDVEVTVDGCLYGTPTPDAPVNQPKQTFTLFETENIVGRGGKDIRVHIQVRDDGVSRRQAVLIRKPDGGLTIRDLGSANGTQVNGTELVPGVETEVRDGDRIAIGAWTRLTVRAVEAFRSERTA